MSNSNNKKNNKRNGPQSKQRKNTQYRNQKNNKRYDNRRNNHFIDNNYKDDGYVKAKHSKELLQEDYSITRQQVFDFDEMKFSDELDTSFIENKRKKKEKIIDELNESYSKAESAHVAKEKKQQKKKNFTKIFFTLCLFILLIGAIVISIYALTRPDKVKIVTKEKEVVKIDDNYLFLGDSITEFYDLDEYYGDLPVVNSGISGNSTEDILGDMEKRVYQYNPSKVFLLIGTNDIHYGTSLEEIVSNIEEIVSEIRKNRPYAEVYVESIYPVNQDMDGAEDRTNKEIMEINKKIEKYCKDKKITYIDMFSLLKDPDSDEVKLKEDYTKDGLHLSDKGYDVVTREIKKYLK